ncbi:MAG: Grx4 family monothiol glutaredoxin [Planctomycetes bacterium]|nr:Grx4 family monothiol glutaredoxin [Planctomycetota bacterium]
MWTPETVKDVVSKHRLVIFAKGTKEQPMCGFSHRAIHIMNLVGQPFEVVNIFDDPSIRPALVEFSKWPTTPQLFVDGELIGGSDIVLEMYESGELQQKIAAAKS